MLLNMLLQGIATATITIKEILDIVLAVFVIIGTIWGIYAAFSKKANKNEVLEALDKIDKKKLDVERFEHHVEDSNKEFDRHDEMIRELMNDIRIYRETIGSVQTHMSVTNAVLERIEKKCDRKNC